MQDEHDRLMQPLLERTVAKKQKGAKGKATPAAAQRAAAAGDVVDPSTGVFKVMLPQCCCCWC